MGKTSNCSEKAMELKKGPWTRDEDQKLRDYIQEYGHGSWRTLPAKAGLERCGKSCRMRWTNYLRPDIKRGKFSTQEEKTIIRLHALMGNRWSAISAHLPKRTDNEIKNYWNTRLKKRLTRMGIDPVTHKPKNIPAGPDSTNLSHMAQWETARLEAEARLVRKSKILRNIQLLHKTTGPPPPPPQPTVLPCLDVLKVWQATSGQTGFFASTGSLESPTSTLNFSNNGCNTIIPTVHGSSFIANDINCVAVKDRMENSYAIENHANCWDYEYNYGNISGLMDFATMNPDCDLSEIVGDSDEDRNYWSELLRLVSSPNGSPLFQV